MMGDFNPKHLPKEGQMAEAGNIYYVYTVFSKELYGETPPKPSEAYDSSVHVIGAGKNFTPEDALRSIVGEYDSSSLVYIAVCRDPKCEDIILEKH